MVGKEVYFCRVKNVNNSHLSLNKLLLGTTCFAPEKYTLLEYKNNVENANMQDKNPLRYRKKTKDTPITYIACSSFPESMASVTSTDGKRGVFRSVTTSHGRQDMRSKYETQLWTSC